MDKRFEAAVSVVKAHLETNQYSYSTTRFHVRCFKLLSRYLAGVEKPYSEYVAKQWLQSIESGLCRTTVSTYKRALKKLAAAYNQKDIGTTKTQYDKRQNYRRLDPWATTLLDTFLRKMSGTYSRYYLRTLKTAIARFLTYVVKKGGYGPSDITHRLTADFYRDDEHSSHQVQNAYNRLIQKFLQYLADKGKIQLSIYLTLDKFVLQRLVFIETLSGNEQKTFRENSEASVIEAVAYYRKALETAAIIDVYSS